MWHLGEWYTQKGTKRYVEWNREDEGTITGTNRPQKYSIFKEDTVDTNQRIMFYISRFLLVTHHGTTLHVFISISLVFICLRFDLLWKLKLRCTWFTHPWGLISDPSFVVFVYYESIKQEVKIKPIYECRCDERLKTKAKESTHLTSTRIRRKTCSWVKV